MIMLHPLSLSLYTITESQYLDTINNDDIDDGNNSTITVEEDKTSIQTVTTSFADKDESGDDNTTLLSLSVEEDKKSIQTTTSSFAEEDESDDDDNTTLLSLSRWDADSRSCTSSSSSNSGPPIRPVRRRRNTM